MAFCGRGGRRICNREGLQGGAPFLLFQSQLINKECRGDPRSQGNPLSMQHSSSIPGTKCYHEDKGVFLDRASLPQRTREHSSQNCSVIAAESLCGFGGFSRAILSIEKALHH